MTTSIEWVDAIGAAQLTNTKPAPADRFAGWVPFPVSVTSESEALATGQPFVFVFSEREGVTFSLTGIPNTSQSLVLRLMRWLNAGGVVTVHTGDASDRSYPSCYQPKGAKASFVLSDARHLEYSLTLTLINTAGDPMLCVY